MDKTAFAKKYYLKPFIKRIHFMRRICQEIKIKPFGFHAIRHFRASHLFAKGNSVNTVQTILRHKAASTAEGYLKSIGLDPVVKQALEEGIRRPAVVIEMDKKRASEL